MIIVPGLREEKKGGGGEKGRKKEEKLFEKRRALAFDSRWESDTRTRVLQALIARETAVVAIGGRQPFLFSCSSSIYM